LLISIALFLAVTLVTATSVAGASSQPPNSFGIRLVGVPGTQPSDPRARSYIVDHLAPGSSSHRQVEVANATRSVLQVSVYSAAAAISNGTFTFAPDRTVNELTTWIAVDRATLSMGPRSAARVNVATTVPRDASPGERYAVIWAEVRSSAPAGSGAVIVNRVGVRVYLSVGPGGPPAANFQITSIKVGRTTAGRPTVTALVRNTGGRAVDVGGNLQLTAGPGGVSAGPFTTQQVTTLAPGDTGALITTLDKGLPEGPWTVSVDLKSGFVEATGQARIRFPQYVPKGAPPKRSLPLGALAAGGVLGGVLVVALAVTMVRRRRRSGSSEAASV
jgi:hypothetical protein